MFASALDARVSNRGGCTVPRNLISYNLMPTCPQRCDRAAGHNSDGPDRKLMPRGKSGIRVCRGLCTDDTDTLVRMRCTRYGHNGPSPSSSRSLSEMKSLGISASCGCARSSSRTLWSPNGRRLDHKSGEVEEGLSRSLGRI